MDLGETLFDLLGSTNKSGKIKRAVDVVSFKEALVSPKVTWNENRTILIESAWPSWRGAGRTRFSARKSQFLMFYDQPIKNYNSLIDRSELQPDFNGGPYLDQLKEDVLKILGDKNLEPWQGLPSSLLEKLKIGQTLWSGDQANNWSKQSLIFLIQKRPWDRQVFGWLAMMAVERKNWKLLQALGKKSGVKEWLYIASLYLNIPFTEQLTACSQYLQNMSDKKWTRPSPQECHNPLFMSLLDWEHAAATEKNKLKEEFFRQYEYFKLDEMISIENYKNGLFWDTAIDIPYEPSLVDLFIARPDSKDIRLAIQKRFGEKLRVMK